MRPTLRALWRLLVLVGVALIPPGRCWAAPVHTLDVDLIGPAGLEVSQICIAGSAPVDAPTCRPPAASSFATCEASADSSCSCSALPQDPSLSCGAYFKPTSTPLQCRAISGVRSGYRLVLDLAEASNVVIEYAGPSSLALRFTASSAPRISVLGGDFAPSGAPIQPRDFGGLPGGRRYLAQVPLETRCQEYNLVSGLAPQTPVCVKLPWPDASTRAQLVGSRIRLPVAREAWPQKAIEVHVTPSCTAQALGAKGHDVLRGSWQSDSPPLDIPLGYVSFLVSWRRPQCFPQAQCPRVAVHGQPPCERLPTPSTASGLEPEGACRYRCSVSTPVVNSVSMLLEHSQKCGPSAFEQVWTEVLALASSRELASYVPASQQMMCLEYDLRDWRALTWRNQIEEVEVSLPTGSSYRVAVPEKPSGATGDSAYHVLPANGVTCGAKVSYEYVGARQYKRGSTELTDGYVVNARTPSELARRAYSFGLGVGAGMQNMRYAGVVLGYSFVEVNAMTQLNEPLFRIGNFFPQARVSALFSRQPYQIESAVRSGIAPRWEALPYVRIFGELLGVLEGDLSYLAVGGGVGYGGPMYTKDNARLFKRLLLSPRVVGGLHVTSAITLEASLRMTLREQAGHVDFAVDSGAGAADRDEFVGNPRLQALAVDGPEGLPVMFWGAMLRVDDPI
jgi:hypothetical protein